MQQSFYIAVSGSTQKKDRLGQPYGWRVNVYDKAVNWAPSEWLKRCEGLDTEGAREKILETGIAIGKNVSRAQLAKAFGMKQ